MLGAWTLTYIRVKGDWVYLYRAVDSAGATIDFLLSAKRDTAAAKALPEPEPWEVRTTRTLGLSTPTRTESAQLELRTAMRR